MTRLTAALFFFIFVTACSTAVAGGTGGTTTVGVIPFGNSDDNSRWISEKLQDFLRSTLEENPEYNVAAPRDLNRAFEDAGFDPSGFRYGVPPEFIPLAGNTLGADLMIFGFVAPTGGSEYQVIWNIMVVSSGNTISPAPSMVPKNTGPVQELAAAMVEAIGEHIGGRVEETLNMASYHASVENWPMAIMTYKQVLDVDPAHIEARLALAGVYMMAAVDSLPQAEVLYNGVLAEQPGNSDALAGLGNIALRRQQYESAQTYFEQAIEADPDNASAYAGLASAYNGLGMVDQALASFESALAANPQNLQARYALGLLYAQTGDYTHAIPHMEAILEVRPDWDNIRMRLAKAQEETGAYGSAADNAVIVLNNSYDEQTALYVAQLEAKAGRTTSAVNRLEGIIGSTGNRQAYLLLATVYRDSGQRSAMQSVFNRLQNAYPGDPTANYMVGSFYYQSGVGKAQVSELIQANIPTWESAINDLNAAVGFLNQVTGYRSSQAQNMVAAARNAITLCEEKIDRVRRYSE
jgi:tetratricopeptide (TPR) repeat protein